MTIEQITALVNAGFTKDDILAMTAQEQAQQMAQEPAAQEPAQEPAQQTAQAQAQAQLQQMAQKTAQEPAQPEISLADVIKSNQAVMENISKLTAAVQANAIRTAVQPNGGQPAYTAEQAIAEIIAPPRKEH